MRKPATITSWRPLSLRRQARGSNLATLACNNRKSEDVCMKEPTLDPDRRQLHARALALPAASGVSAGLATAAGRRAAHGSS